MHAAQFSQEGHREYLNVYHAVKSQVLTQKLWHGTKKKYSTPLNATEGIC